MYRDEFETLAHIGKTSFFSILTDPVVQAELDYKRDATGRGHVNRRNALVYIRRRRLENVERRQRRAAHLGVYSTPDAPARGRPCPFCRRRIAQKVTVCRHCATPVPIG